MVPVDPPIRLETGGGSISERGDSEPDHYRVPVGERTFLREAEFEGEKRPSKSALDLGGVSRHVTADAT